MNNFVLVPCLDTAELAAGRRRELDIRRDVAAELGRSAVEIAERGVYLNAAGERVEIGGLVSRAVTGKRSLPADALLPPPKARTFDETRIQVANETTLGASRRLVDLGHRPLALNFANGIYPGGGFLRGAKAQEEVLCRSSALYRTLVGDPMYDAHRKRPRPDSTDWAIYSPEVPVFRHDDGTPLDQPWLLSFITCAAPYVPEIGQPESGDLLQKRIHRVLAIGRAFGYSTLVLGAWGCGAFGNDPRRTAIDFRDALENQFRGAFSDIVLAITDWSPNEDSSAPSATFSHNVPPPSTVGAEGALCILLLRRGSKFQFVLNPAIEEFMTFRDVTRPVIERVESVSGYPVVVSEYASLETFSGAGTRARES